MQADSEFHQVNQNQDSSNVEGPARSGPPLPGNVFPPSFYDCNTKEVALDLLGRIVCHGSDGWLKAGRIVEVEAYLGRDDPACHIGRGFTPRTEGIFDKPGLAYIFIVYGLHHCLNAITLSHHPHGCVLIRAVEPWDLDREKQEVGCDDIPAGPGLVGRYLGISRKQNGTSLSEGPIIILDEGPDPKRIEYRPRIGVSAWKEKLLRIYDADSACISKH